MHLMQASYLIFPSGTYGIVRNNIIYQSPDKKNIIPKSAAPRQVVQQGVNTSLAIWIQAVRVWIRQEI
jgi:hypothetical protein